MEARKGYENYKLTPAEKKVLKYITSFLPYGVDVQTIGDYFDRHPVTSERWAKTMTYRPLQAGYVTRFKQGRLWFMLATKKGKAAVEEMKALEEKKKE